MTKREQDNFEYDTRVLAAIRAGATRAQWLNEKVGQISDRFTDRHNRSIDNSLRRLKKNRLITYDKVWRAWRPVVSTAALQGLVQAEQAWEGEVKP